MHNPTTGIDGSRKHEFFTSYLAPGKRKRQNNSLAKEIVPEN
jgi:hypothetical protein